MATIPRITRQRAQSQQLPGGRLSASAPAGAFGPDLTGVGNQITDMALRAQDRANTAQVMDADTQLTAFENNALYDPEKGALNTRGKNAFGVPEEVMQRFDSRVGEIRKNLQGPQLTAFEKLVAQRRQQMSSTLQRHVTQQISTYEQEQADALITSSQIAAGNNYNNPERINMELRRQRGAVLARARDLGWSPERTQLALRQAESTTHGAVIDRMGVNDPQAAVQYYVQHAPEMAPQDRVAYDKVVNAMRTRQQADSIVGSLVGGTGAGAEGVWARMIQQESGGAQFAADGQPLTSSKGAIGIAQVMPDTAPEAARMAGLEWDEERYRTDPEYNLALGKAYFTSQMEKYGSPALAAAAYNAGPGNVDAWLEKYGDPREGDISMEQWVRNIPFAETQAYVRNATKGAEPAAELTRSQQMAVVNQMPADVREAAQSRLNAVWKQQDMQLAEHYESVKQSVENGTSFYDLDPRAVDQLKADQIQALKARSKELAGGPVEMDWKRWTELSMMTREELAQIDDPYTALRPHLDDGHYEKAVKMIESAKGIGEDITTSATLTFNQRVKNAAMQSGIVPADETSSQYSEEQALTYARFQNEAAARIEQRERDLGRRLTGNEQQETLDEMLLEKIMVDDSIFGDGSERYTWALPEDDVGDAYVPMNDIPQPDAEFVKNLLISNGHAPSDDVVQRAYAQYRLGNRERFQEIITRGR